MRSVLGRKYKLARGTLALSTDLVSRTSIVVPEGELVLIEGQHAGDAILSLRHRGSLFFAFREDVLRNGVEVHAA